MAGLEVLRILNEPTAAALAYGYGRASSERIAVYDFGGGTFDVTLLDLSNNVFEVLATAGNTFLGGDDLDLAIAERMAELLVAQHRIDARTDLQAFERLRAAAETIKHRLSTESEARVTVHEVGHGIGGRSVDFDFSMTRGELERLAVPIIDKTFDVCREALGIARLSTNDFDQVLVVGGSTRIPLVRSRVEEFFRRPLRANINPDEVVAIGAAIQAAALSGAERRKGTIPPAPSPASRQTQPDLSDASPAAGRKRPSTHPGVPPMRQRMESSQSIPSTQPFFGRQHVSTQPGLAPGQSGRPPGTTSESTLGALGKAPTLVPNTLGGLGPRQRIKTGPGLGPEATRANSGPTLVSASEEARSAREALNDELGLPLVGAPPPLAVAPTRGERQESVAFTLGDGDFFELESAPIQASRTLGAYSTPPLPGVFDEAALPLPEVPDEEITHVGAPPEPSAPRAAPAPMAGHTLTTKRAPYAPPAPPISPADTAPHPTPFGPPPMPIFPPAFAAQRTAPLAGFGVLQAPTQAPSYPPGGFESVPVARSSSPAPLLIDVTPLTLAVETVNGFCDAVIERNTQVPCERTRVFVTATDHQSQVRVRIAQGESSRFGENTLLGEVELSGLGAALRGEVQIAVSFSLDTNGMLNVSAKEVATGRATATQVRLVALPDAGDIARMTQRNSARQM